MLTIFNRKELIVTMDIHRQAEIRDVLAQNDIDYTVKTKNLQNSGALDSQRGRIGNMLPQQPPNIFTSPSSIKDFT